MRLKDVFTLTRNSTTNQDGGTLKRKKLKKLGLTPEQLLEMILLKPKTKFYKK